MNVTHHLHEFVIFSWWSMSALTLGVAVAVSAMIGTPGKFFLNSLSFL